MKKALLLVTLLISLLILAVLLYGIVGTTLHGKVIDKVTKRPISGAEVRVNIRGKKARTSSRGVFEIRGVWGELQLTIESTGYEEYQKDMQVSFWRGKNLGKITLEAVPTKERAKKLVSKYQNLADDGRYVEMYGLLTPQDRKLVSKETFVKKQREESVREERWPWSVGAVYLKGNKAKVSVFYDKPSGREIEVIEVWFTDGKWFRKLNVDNLILFGVSLDKIPEVERAKLGDEVSANGFDVIINKAGMTTVIMAEVSGSQVETYTAQGKFITITVTVTNTSEEGEIFSPDEYLILINKTGKNYATSKDVMPVMSELVSEEIPPSTSRKGQLVFDVPEGTSGFKLVVGSGDKRYVISLGV